MSDQLKTTLTRRAAMRRIVAVTGVAAVTVGAAPVAFTTVHPPKGWELLNAHERATVQGVIDCYVRLSRDAENKGGAR